MRLFLQTRWGKGGIIMNFRIVVFVLFLLIGYGAFAHSEDRGKQLFDKVVGSAKECAAGKSGSEVTTCYIKATPKKCQQHVINLLSREEIKRL
jgi:hypothetical protein